MTTSAWPCQSAANSRRPSALAATPTVPAPAAMRATSRRVAMSISPMLPSPAWATATSPRPGRTATPAGAGPLGTVATTRRACRSMTLTSSLPWLVIQASAGAGGGVRTGWACAGRSSAIRAPMTPGALSARSADADMAGAGFRA